jgi:hypothetical protein
VSRGKETAIISRRNDQVMGIALREFRKLIYGATSPYAPQVEYDDVERLTREDLAAFHTTYYRPDTTILAVWGDFAVPDMKAKLDAAFAGFAASGPAPAVAAASVPAPAPSLNYIEKKDVEQTFILAGRLGLRLDDPDYPAIWVMSDILGGGFASRIFVKVRTEKGLAYAAGGGMSPAMDHAGAFYFFTSTKPSTTAEALATMLGEIKKIREAPVTDAELQVLDGDRGFVKMGPKSQPLPERAVAEMKRALYTDFGCLRLLKEGPAGTPKAWAGGDAEFEGRKADDVLIGAGDGVFHVYLAPDTGEVLGTRRSAQTEEGAVDVVTAYSNYQIVSGVRIPFGSVQKVKGEVKSDVKLTTVKVNGGFAEGVFNE